MDADDAKERRRREFGLTFSPGEMIWIALSIVGLGIVFYLAS